jgi:hypothetical protein
MCVFSCLQLASELIVWSKLLKKLAKPVWQLGFLFFTLIAAIVYVITAFLKIDSGILINIILGVFGLGGVIIGLLFIYYLGFSTKIKFISKE